MQVPMNPKRPAMSGYTVSTLSRHLHVDILDPWLSSWMWETLLLRGDRGAGQRERGRVREMALQSLPGGAEGLLPRKALLTGAVASAVMEHPHCSGHHPLQTTQSHETSPECRLHTGIWESSSL